MAGGRRTRETSVEDSLLVITWPMPWLLAGDGQLRFTEEG